MPDPVHLLVTIPPKYSVANTVGFLKGKSAIRIHRVADAISVVSTSGLEAIVQVQ